MILPALPVSDDSLKARAVVVLGDGLIVEHPSIIGVCGLLGSVRNIRLVSHGDAQAREALACGSLLDTELFRNGIPIDLSAELVKMKRTHEQSPARLDFM